MGDEPEPIKCVVKGTTPSGDVVWLTVPDSDGFRNLGPRRMAEEFQNRSEARLAIAALPRPFREAGFLFWVTVARTDADKKLAYELAISHFGEDRAFDDLKRTIWRMLNDE